MVIKVFFAIRIRIANKKRKGPEIIWAFVMRFMLKYITD